MSPSQARKGVYLTKASEIVPEQIEWLDEGWVPLRTVTLVTGVDGVGKSTILGERAARASRGQLRGKYYGQAVDVVMASSEDHAASVIVPRLYAAGADLTRIHTVRVGRDGLDGDVSLPDDLDGLVRRVKEVSARLLIVDPLVAHLPLHIDSHKAQHVRRVLAPLAHLAEEAELAVAAVVHFNGAPSTDVRTRISGSKALRDASRSVLVCGLDPSDESRSVMVQDKNSYGPRASTGRGYRIKGTTTTINGRSFPTARVKWLGEVQITSQSLLAGPDSAEERSVRDLAKDVILDALEARAPLQWIDLLERLGQESVSERTGVRARVALRDEGLIYTTKNGGGPWLWNLATPHGQVPTGQVLEPLPDNGSGPSQPELGHTRETGQVHTRQASA